MTNNALQDSYKFLKWKLKLFKFYLTIILWQEKVWTEPSFIIVPRHDLNFHVITCLFIRVYFYMFKFQLITFYLEHRDKCISYSDGRVASFVKVLCFVSVWRQLSTTNRKLGPVDDCFFYSRYLLFLFENDLVTENQKHT